MATMMIFAMNAFAAPLSSMSSDDLVTLYEINSAASASGRTADSAKGSAVAVESGQPVELTAHDLMTKVYGVVDSSLSEDECRRSVRSCLALEPQEDQSALWLDSADGYGVNYRGMQPEVSAMARYENGELSDYCFFFLFPMDEKDTRFGERSEQCEFCGSLLQEMHDMGMTAGADRLTDDLFNVIGEYEGNLVDVRLIGDAGSDRYILIVGVEPGAFTEADNLAAL